MNDYVLCWWARGEFAEQRGDFQTGASVDQAGSDLLQDDASLTAMQQTPLGEPPTDFDVRCVYDSRPVNGYDFNLSAVIAAGGSGGSWTAEFVVPNGYRAVPREWQVIFDDPPNTAPGATTVSLLQNGAALPNNGTIIVGAGTSNPIKSFYVCEENTTFGIAGIGAVFASNVNINVYGNLIPVTDVALPLSIANRKAGT